MWSMMQRRPSLETMAFEHARAFEYILMCVTIMGVTMRVHLKLHFVYIFSVSFIYSFASPLLCRLSHQGNYPSHRLSHLFVKVQLFLSALQKEHGIGR